jgi:hypothetical protein
VITLGVIAAFSSMGYLSALALGIIIVPKLLELGDRRTETP